MRQYLDRTTFKKLYYTLVFPYLIYCCEIWGNTACSYLHPLIKLKKCVRAITFSNYLTPSTPIFNNLNILKFEKLVVQRISLMMFKFNIGEVPKPISDLFMLIVFSITIILEVMVIFTLHLIKVKLAIVHLAISALIFGIIMSQNVSINVSYSKLKFLTIFYILNNEIPIIRLNV